jgi:multimeric flavodoxin WrbA
LRDACRGKVYAGLAVGAKRNGGQETTLIYQMLDMVNLDFLCVGNDSETTSQYGGTAVAGDVGKLHTDAYGIDTCIGTGRRAARVATLLERGRSSTARMRDPLRVQLWLLQDDRKHTGLTMFKDWAGRMMEGRDDLDIQILDIAGSEVVRCIACDICPTRVGASEDYRCIITAADDFFVKNHTTLISADAVLLCAYSPKNRKDVVSAYQQFIERTRYIRRDNYALANLMAAPFVISELSARQNLHLRMLTSIMRHQTVLHHPMIGIVHQGKLLDAEHLLEGGRSFVDAARELTIGRYLSGHRADVIYHPVGYEISAHKADEDKLSGRTGMALQSASKSMAATARKRILDN